jgi:hypothetical protein
VEPLAFSADLPPQVTFTGAVVVGAELAPPALLWPPHAERINAQQARMLRAAPNRFSFNPIPFTDEIIAAGIASARRTAVFLAGMRHRNKIRAIDIMPGHCRFVSGSRFRQSFPHCSRHGRSATGAAATAPEGLPLRLPLTALVACLSHPRVRRAADVACPSARTTNG